MIRIEAGDDLLLNYLTIKNEIFTPDAGNIRIRLKDQSGVTVVDDTTDFSSEIIISETDLQLPIGEYFKLYTLIIQFESEGKNRVFRDYIRVQKPVTLFINEDQVRASLGVSEEELPDEDIDLFSRYVTISNSLGIDVLSDESMLQTGNELVLYQECLQQILFLELKLLKSVEADDIRKSRLGKFDFEAYRARFEGLIRKLKEEFDPEQAPEVISLIELIPINDAFAGS